MCSNKVEYSIAVGLYCTTHDSKVPFFMPDFSSSKIINHRFRVNNYKGESGIGYDMIIGRDLMKRQVLKWGGATVLMKEPSSFLGGPDLNKRDISEVVMQTLDTASTREDTEILIEIVDSAYAKADLSQVAAKENHINDGEITQLLKLLKYLGELFGGTLGYWDTKSVNLDKNSGLKKFNSKYYLVPRINKKTFCKDIKCLVEIGVLTLVQ